MKTRSPIVTGPRISPPRKIRTFSPMVTGASGLWLIVTRRSMSVFSPTIRLGE